MILGGRGKDEPYEPLAAAFAPGDRAYLIGEADGGDRSGARRGRGRRSSGAATWRAAVAAAARDARDRRRRAALAGLRELRPVHELRAARGGVREAGAEAPGVKSRSAGQLEQRLLVLVTLGLVAFGLVMVFSATSASAALGAGDPMTFLIKQGAYALVGLVLLALASRFDYHRLRADRTDPARRRARPLCRRARRGAADQRRATLVPGRADQRAAVRDREDRGAASGRARSSRGGRRRGRWAS